MNKNRGNALILEYRSWNKELGYRNKPFVWKHVLQPLLDKLVGTTHQLQPIYVIKLQKVTTIAPSIECSTHFNCLFKRIHL